MKETTLISLFSVLIISLLAMNIDEKWSNLNYERLKDKKYIWYWFKIFKVSETKENFKKLSRGLSVSVISVIVMIWCWRIYLLIV
jgi:hypothetical protein